MQRYRFNNFTSVRLVLVFLLACFGSSFALADDKKIRIVTDIAPIHSLVSMIVGQQAEVSLLIPPGQSPHSFSLKPSQLRTIHQAALIVTLSEDFTPALSRHLAPLKESTLVLQLSDVGKPHRTAHNQLVPTNQTQGSNELNENINDNNHTQNTPLENLRDPHTWLNPENAIAWLDTIANAIIKLDGQNRSLYQDNTVRAKSELASMHAEFAKRLSMVKSARYIVYHDAYQHFALSYDLQKPISIALSDARAPGARKLRAMREQARQSKCVFSELLHEDVIVDTVTQGLPVKRATLDPMGSTLPIGPNQYPQLMSALVDNFVACLI